MEGGLADPCAGDGLVGFDVYGGKEMGVHGVCIFLFWLRERRGDEFNNIITNYSVS